MYWHKQPTHKYNASTTNLVFISYLVSEWERMGSSSRQLRQNTCLCFSLLLGARAQIPPVSPRKKPGETREKERDTNNQAAIRKPVCPRVPADFPYKCSSVKLQTADSPRFLQSPRLGCSSVHQIEKYQQLWVCMWEDLCMCVPSVNGGVCLCGKEAKATTWCKLNPPPTG